MAGSDHWLVVRRRHCFAVEAFRHFVRVPILGQQFDLALREIRPVALLHEAGGTADKPHLSPQRCPEPIREMAMVPAWSGGLIEQQYDLRVTLLGQSLDVNSPALLLGQVAAAALGF